MNTSPQQETTEPRIETESSAADDTNLDQEGQVAEGAAKRSAPVHRLSYGRLQASIWRNELRDGSVNYTVTLRRSYTDAGGVWRDSTSFGRDDMLVVAKLASEAHSVIHSLQRQARQRGQGEAEAGQGGELEAESSDAHAAPTVSHGPNGPSDARGRNSRTSDAATRRGVAAAAKDQRAR